MKVRTMKCIRCDQREAAAGPAKLCGTCLWDLWGLANRDTMLANADADRLRSVLRRIQQWDSLNPPQPNSDFPWLRKLVDVALGDDKTAKIGSGGDLVEVAEPAKQ